MIPATVAYDLIDHFVFDYRKAEANHTYTCACPGSLEKLLPGNYAFLQEFHLIQTSHQHLFDIMSFSQNCGSALSTRLVRKQFERCLAEGLVTSVFTTRHSLDLCILEDYEEGDNSRMLFRSKSMDELS